MQWPLRRCEMHSPEDVPALYPEAEAVLDALRCGCSNTACFELV